MLQDGGSILSYTLLVTKTPAGDAELLMTSLAGLLPFSIPSKTMRKQNCTKDAGGLGRSRLFFNPQPWPVYIARGGEKIDFAEGVKLK